MARGVDMINGLTDRRI